MTSAKGLYIDPPTNKWRIGKELGSGACGSVHELLKSSSNGTSDTKTKFVIKVVPNVISNTTKKKRKKTIAEKNSDLLCHENTLYNNVLNDLRGNMIPDIPFGASNKVPRSPFGEIDAYRFLVMEQMEQPLSAIASLLRNHTNNNKNNNTTSIPIGTICSQFISIIEAIHSNHHVAVDIKSDNFMLAFPSSSSTTKKSSSSSSSMKIMEKSIANRLRMIDLGLLESYKSYTDGKIKHRPDLYPGVSLVGTPTYASVNVLNGHTVSRRDDLEACGYVICELVLQIMYFGCDQIIGGDEFCKLLPWSTNVTCDEDILCQKEDMMKELHDDDDDGVRKSSTKNSFWSMFNPNQMNEEGTTEILKSFFRFVTSLDFKQTPDYDEIRSILADLKVVPVSKQQQHVGGTSKKKASKPTTSEKSTLPRKRRTTRSTTVKKNTSSPSSAEAAASTIAIDVDDTSPPLADVSNAMPNKRKTRTSRRAAATAARASSNYSSSGSSEQSSLKPRRKRVTRVTTTIEILDSDEEDTKVGTTSDANIARATSTAIDRVDENGTHYHASNNDDRNDIMSIDEYQSIPGTTYSGDFKSCHSTSPEGQMDWEYMNEDNDEIDNESSHVAGIPSSALEQTTAATNNENKSVENVELKTASARGSKAVPSSSNVLYLVCTQGPHSGESIPIKSTTVVGQGTCSQVKTKGKRDVYSLEKDEDICTSHVKIVLCRKEGGKGNYLSLRVTDLSDEDSSTVVNGKSIKKGGSGKQVFIGNKIQIGRCLFIVSKKSN